jgi:hypothetical protein
MDLSVTIGMQKHKVGSLVRSASSLRKDVMDVPSCFLRYRPTTVRASALLLLPKMKQASFSLEIVLHDQAEPALEVFFPCWIERIGFTFDFDMAADRGIARFQQRDPFPIAIPCCHLSAEDPVFPTE